MGTLEKKNDALPDELHARYAGFLDAVVRSGEVWGLWNDDTWTLWRESDTEPLAMLVWKSRETVDLALRSLALESIKDRALPESIPLEKWRGAYTVDLTADGMQVALVTGNSDALQVVMVLPDDFSRDIGVAADKLKSKSADMLLQSSDLRRLKSAAIRKMANKNDQ